MRLAAGERAMMDRRAVVYAGASVAAAVAWTAGTVTGPAPGLQWFSGSFGVAALLLALGGGFARLLGWATVGLLGEYMVSQSARTPELIDVVWHAALLVAVIEFGAASLERRVAAAEGGPAGRPAPAIAGAIAAGAIVSLAVGVATVIPGPGGLAGTVLAVAAAIAVLVALRGLAASPQDERP